MKIVDDADVRRIDEHLVGVLDRAFAGGCAARLRDRVRAFVLAGGKRVRPQLCVWAYDAVRDPPGAVRAAADSRSPALLDVACAWELFHAFLLVHDDIIDDAAARRDRPSLHHQLALLDGGSLTFGTNLAIVAGDLLFTTAMGVLHDVDLPPAAHRKLLRLFTTVATSTGAGQADDIVLGHEPLAGLSERAVLDGYDRKTAGYTFGGPLVSGAVVAGAGADVVAALERFSACVGQAYQLHNDLLDLAAPAHAGCDLMQGKRTVTLMRARAAMSPTDRAALDADLARLHPAGPGALALAESLRRRVLATPAVDQTRELIDALLCRADAATRTVAPTVGDRLAGLLTGLKVALSPERRPTGAEPSDPAEGGRAAHMLDAATPPWHVAGGR